jgi:hypothetical protein
MSDNIKLSGYVYHILNLTNTILTMLLILLFIIIIRRLHHITSIVLLLQINQTCGAEVIFKVPSTLSPRTTPAVLSIIHDQVTQVTYISLPYLLLTGLFFVILRLIYLFFRQKVWFRIPTSLTRTQIVVTLRDWTKVVHIPIQYVEGRPEDLIMYVPKEVRDVAVKGYIFPVLTFKLIDGTIYNKNAEQNTLLQDKASLSWAEARIARKIIRSQSFDFFLKFLHKDTLYTIETTPFIICNGFRSSKTSIHTINRSMSRNPVDDDTEENDDTYSIKGPTRTHTPTPRMYPHLPSAPVPNSTPPYQPCTIASPAVRI